jgi:hypothetical protein
MGSCLPLKDIRKNLCLLYGVFEGVMGMSTLRAKGGQQFGLSSFRDRKTSLDCKGCFDIEAKRVIERRTICRKTDEIPVEPSPIEAQRVRD